MRVLVVNAGSSSLKLRVLGDGDVLLWARDLEPVEPGEAAPQDRTGASGTAGPGPDASGALRAALTEAAGLGPIDAVGHRVVHGGTQFREAVIVDRDVLAALWDLTPLAPLHQPRSLAALEAVADALPGLPNVACFDTAFHATIPEAAATYALPEAWRRRWPLRRFGFHGLSHAYAARRAAELVGRAPEDLRIVTCHLGAGASLAAVLGGRSIDTTMGFTPLEGLVMATRSGDVDPGLVLWLQREAGLSAQEVWDGLEHEGGLRGLAGTEDMAAVIDRAASADPAANFALDVYVHRLAKGIAAMAASLGGLDVLVFTGGVGENAPDVRRRAAGRLAFLGVELDGRRNASVGGRSGRGDAVVGADGARVSTLVVESREDLEIARQVRATTARHVRRGRHRSSRRP